jgi:hypothetical protein
MNLEFLKVIEKAGSLATLIYVKLLRRSKVERLFFEHGLRANAFRACREGKSCPPRIKCGAGFSGSASSWSPVWKWTQKRSLRWMLTSPNCTTTILQSYSAEMIS